MESFTEENYLKAIYKLLEKGGSRVSTNDLAERMETAPASATDMMKKLAKKKLIHYEKYQGVSLTAQGRKTAIGIIRKHRLWEMFLVTKLDFKWDEVHEVAEQLEHIQSDSLIQRLDQFLGKPKFDPHGDPIPDDKGYFQAQKTTPLSEAKESNTVIITRVIDHHPSFLRFLEVNSLLIGKKIKIREIIEYDKSMNILIIQSKTTLHISHEVAKNIIVLIQ